MLFRSGVLGGTLIFIACKMVELNGAVSPAPPHPPEKSLFFSPDWKIRIFYRLRIRAHTNAHVMVKEYSFIARNQAGKASVRRKPSVNVYIKFRL